jgi:alkylation response protein AidB-like acyl-CoA dehydrogenase
MAVIGELTDVQKQIVDTVRDFVDREVIPIADELEHRDEYPEKIVEQMKEMGLFGLRVPEAYGGIGEALTTYALVVIELSRGWMSLSGILNTHFIAAWQISTYGTEEQKQKFLPRMATGEERAALSMSEPHAGSDVQAIRCRADLAGGTYKVTGTKMWVTNGLRSGIVMLLCKTNPEAEPPSRGMGIDATVPFGYESDFMRPVYPVGKIDLKKWFNDKDIQNAKARMQGWVHSLARTGR